MADADNRTQMPDPNGDPEPVWKEAAFCLGPVLRDLAIIVGGVALALVACPLTPTMGATRSAHLQWEARRQVAQEAMLEQNAATSAVGALPQEEGHE